MKPLRTHATSLTDDELILLDVLFSHHGTSYRLLRQRDFVAQWNCQSHALNDDQLAETLNRMVNVGWLETWEHGNRGCCYRMIPAGGRQWELERAPEWDRYAIDRYGETRSGEPLVTIAATTAERRDDFWRIGCEVGMLAHSLGRVRRATIRNHALIPWKTFPAIYVLVARLDDWAVSSDWRALEERRTWWRCVRENEKFWDRRDNQSVPRIV